MVHNASDMHYMMGNQSNSNFDSSVDKQGLYTATTHSIFNKNSKIVSRTASKNTSKDGKTASANDKSSRFPYLDSSESQANQSVASLANRSGISMRSKRSIASQAKRKTRMDQLDMLNDTDFGMGMNIVHEEGSVELDQSELFADEDESLINLGGIIGGNN